MPNKKKAAEARKIDVTKIVETVKKIPAFLRRMKSELAKLAELLAKAEAALAAFDGLSSLTKEQKVQKRLLARQVKAMKAYKDALAARVDNEESKLG